MNKYFVALTLFILLTSTNATLSSTQPSVQTGLPSTPASATTFIEESSTVETPTGTLYGTLALPQTGSQVPVVLIIAGSGPTDRNGNSPLLKGANNSLKLLAAALAARGMASLRYDKRGIGETGNAMRIAAEKAKKVLREEDLSFETYIDDTISWGKQLHADRRFSSLTVLGHSEGSPDRHGRGRTNRGARIRVHCWCWPSHSAHHPRASQSATITRSLEGD